MYEGPEVLDYALNELGKPYDWKGVLNFITHKRNWQEDDRWFCSELVAYAFKRAGRPIINNDSYRVTPGDLLLSQKLTHI